MSNGIGAFGAEWKIKISSTFVTVGGLNNISGAGFTKIMSKTTAHDSPGGYDQSVWSGRRTFKDITAELVWNPADDNTHALILSSLTGNDGDALEHQVVFNTGEEFEFDGHIKDIDYTNDQDGHVVATVIIEPSGDITV